MIVFSTRVGEVVEGLSMKGRQIRECVKQEEQGSLLDLLSNFRKT